MEMNLELYNILINAREIFWKFYFYPIIFSGIGVFVLIILHQLHGYFVLAIVIASFSIYNLLFFFWFGTRQKHFHKGDE